MDLSNCYLHTLGDVETQKLEELRQLIPGVVAKAREESSEVAGLERCTIWGKDIEAKNDASDIVFLKFLRAEELNVEKAAERIKLTLIFRAECSIDGLATAELPDKFLGHDQVTGLDCDGRPVMISRFGGMNIADVFGNIEEFVRYRAVLMERAIVQLKFEKGAAEDLCQVHDYSGVPLLFQTGDVKKGVGAVTKVFTDHYPETKGKTILVNFPAAFTKLFGAFSFLMPERTRKKFAILGPADQHLLFQHVPPEVVPEAIGGMFREGPGARQVPCKLVTVKARATEEVLLVHLEDLPIEHWSLTVFWQLRVCNAEIAYEVVFVPDHGDEEVIAKSAPGEYLQTTDGVASGEWHASHAGSVKCRFRNECAWFKTRLCVCGAEAVP